MLASGPYGTLYAGGTDNVPQRVLDHKAKARRGPPWRDLYPELNDLIS